MALRCRPGLQLELAQWIETSPRFSAFFTAYQNKIRKKLTSTGDEEHRLDVRAELLVAFLIVADRRFELAFEAYGARRVGPDLTATFRANQRFNLEVTRVRTTPEPGNATSESADPDQNPDPSVARLANVMAGKLRQLPGEMPNVLVIATRGLALTDDSVVAADRLLKLRTDRKDDEFFAGRGLKDAHDFHVQYLHLSSVVVLDEAISPARAIFWANPEARHPLPKVAVTALMQCLTPGELRQLQ